MSDPEQIWRTAFRHPGRWDDVFPPLSMVELFEASANAHPQASLLDFMGRKYSYGETLDGARRVACGLKALGYGKGDRIGLFLPNVPHYVAAYYGILMLGATVVNFSPLYTADELASQVEDSGTRLLFTLSASALLPTALKVLEHSTLQRLVVGSVAGALPPAKSLFYRLFRGGEVTPRPHDARIQAFSQLIHNDGACDTPAIDPEQDLALIQYTGGTTGVPKGAMLSHQNLSANARQVARLDPHLGEQKDTILGVLPFFHVFANTCVLNRTVLTGGEITMLPRFNAKQALAELRRTRPQSLPGVPTMYQALLDAPGMQPGDFKSLVFCISGGAPLPLALKTQWEQVTGARVIEGYGLSESSGVVSTNPYEGLNKTGTIGQPLAGTRVRLVDESSSELLLSVTRGEADFGLTYIGVNDADIEFESLVSDPFVVACSRNHPFAKRRWVRWKDLEGEPYIALAQGSGNRLLLDQHLANSEHAPRWYCEVRHVPALVSLVESGAGVGVVPRLAMPLDAHSNLVSVPLREPSINRNLGIIRRRGRALGAAAQLFHDLLVASIKERSRP
ncbi:MAG: hypothetical protein EOP60_10040 [Sphingomonadales bacterium]|nr:MAG: hypothetical protein EOP60_10040 [Sphingomonadales bacterium]